MLSLQETGDKKLIKIVVDLTNDGKLIKIVPESINNGKLIKICHIYVYNCYKPGKFQGSQLKIFSKSGMTEAGKGEEVTLRAKY